RARALSIAGIGAPRTHPQQRARSEGESVPAARLDGGRASAGTGAQPMRLEPRAPFTLATKNNGYGKVDYHRLNARPAFITPPQSSNSNAHSSQKSQAQPKSRHRRPNRNR